MSHMRPHGLGWAEGQDATPVEIAADPPGDGVGPDLTPPDLIDEQDPKEHRRLAKDHRQAVKDAAEPHVLDEPEAELHETQHDPRQGKGAR